MTREKVISEYFKKNIDELNGKKCYLLSSPLRKVTFILILQVNCTQVFINAYFFKSVNKGLVYVR